MVRVVSVYQSLQTRALGEEKARLDAQATVGWAMEQEVLGRRLLTGARGLMLDVGCGTGTVARAIAACWPGWSVLGVDTDPRMGAAEEPPRLRFLHVEPGAPLPAPDGSVDAVYGRFLMQHIGDPRPLLAEIKRVLRPGGRVLLADIDDRGVVFHPELPGLRAFYERAGPAQTRVGGDRHVGAKLPALLAQAGLVDVDYEVLPITGGVFGLRPLLAVALGLKRALLGESGDVVETIAAEAEATPGFVALIPVFFAGARRPELPGATR